MNRFPIYIPIIFLILIVILFISFLLINKFSNTSIDKEKMYYRNHFSYEYFYKNALTTKYLRIILVIIAVLLMVSSSLFVATFKLDDKNTFIFGLVIGIFFIIATINSFLTFVIRVNYLSMFKIYVTLLFIFNVMSSVMLGILLMNSMFENAAYKVIGAFLFLNTLINIILMINPKLKDWDKLDVSINDKNEKVYSRPKVMHLAVSIWISYLTLILSVIYMLIVVTLISAGI